MFDPSRSTYLYNNALNNIVHNVNLKNLCKPNQNKGTGKLSPYE